MSTVQDKPPAIDSGHGTPSAEQSPKPKRQLIRSGFRAVWQFTRYMVVLPVAMVRGKRGTNADELTVYSAHPSFFLWLPIAVGFICAAVVERWPNSASVCGASAYT